MLFRAQNTLGGLGGKNATHFPPEYIKKLPLQPSYSLSLSSHINSVNMMSFSFSTLSCPVCVSQHKTRVPSPSPDVSQSSPPSRCSGLLVLSQSLRALSCSSNFCAACHGLGCKRLAARVCPLPLASDAPMYIWEKMPKPVGRLEACKRHLFRLSCGALYVCILLVFLVLFHFVVYIFVLFSSPPAPLPNTKLSFCLLKC